MSTEIKVWHIKDGKLIPINTTMAEAGRYEPQDLQEWIISEPSIWGPDILIIGKEAPTKTGRVDLLGIDKMGNAVITELKRDLLPRDALAQAIDYASDVASWDFDNLIN